MDSECCEYATLTGTVNDQFNEMSGTWIDDSPGSYETGTWHAIKISDTPWPPEGYNKKNDTPRLLTKR